MKATPRLTENELKTLCLSVLKVADEHNLLTGLSTEEAAAICVDALAIVLRQRGLYGDAKAPAPRRSPEVGAY